MSTLLELRGVTVRYGGVTALDSVSMSADAGRITGLIGPNGAGKSTLFNVVSGLVRPRPGTVLLDGRDITRLVPHQRAPLRLATTFQQLALFGVPSGADHVLTAA